MAEERRMDDNNGGMDSFSRVTVGSSPPPPSRSLSILSPPSAAVGVALNCGLNHILHTVSKFDTLAGVAIKYGVEVADIKRLNGLVTDRRMFALKTLKIPLPGRHPPSLRLCNNHDHSSQRYSGVFVISVNNNNGNGKSISVNNNNSSSSIVRDLSHGRSKSWGWALASLMRAFSKPPNSAGKRGAAKPDTPNLAAILSLLAVSS